MSFLSPRKITEEEFYRKLILWIEEDLKQGWKDYPGDEWLVTAWEVYEHARSKIPNHKPSNSYIARIEDYIKTGEY